MWINSGLLVIFCTLPLLIKAQLDPLKVALRQSSITLPPCKLCRTFVDSFKKVCQSDITFSLINYLNHNFY